MTEITPLEQTVINPPETEKKDIIIKILCVLFILFVIALSAAVFLNRGKLQHIGNYGLLGVFALCFISNASVFAPAPGLIVIVTAAAIFNPFLVALTGAFGSTLGELTGFFSGRAGHMMSLGHHMSLGQRASGNIETVKTGKISNMVKKYGSMAVFLFALIPLPLFDIIGVTSGYFGIKLHKFFFACLLGKFIKMICYAFGSVYFQKILNDMNLFQSSLIFETASYTKFV